MTEPLGFLDDDDEDDQEPKPDKANAAFAQQRKELAALKKEAEELRAFKAEREKADRENAISTVFGEVGLNPKHARLFAALNPEGDATPEAVAQFAADYGLVTEGEITVPTPEPKGYTPTVIAEGKALGSKIYSHEEFMDLLATDANKAMEVHKQGRVALNKSPQTVFAGRDR